jgi:hypothetical protein
LEGVLCGSMIDSSIAFSINRLGTVLTPPQYCSFSVTVSAVSSTQAILSKNTKKNLRRKIRGIWKMPPLRLASLPLFPKSQVRRCHPIRFHFESISFPFLFRMIGTGFAFLYQALIPLFSPRHIAPFQSQKNLSRSGTYAATDS